MKSLIVYAVILLACNPTEMSREEMADVIKVEASGNTGSYTFNVTIKSPDTGCDQYADWWEVISPDGRLLYRRILAHSHVNEQPFTRSGGKVDVAPDQTVIVRAHMNNTGYGGAAMRGTVGSGFQSEQLDSDFANALEDEPPLPNGCAF